MFKEVNPSLDDSSKGISAVNEEILVLLKFVVSCSTDSSNRFQRSKEGLASEEVAASLPESPVIWECYERRL